MLYVVLIGIIGLVLTYILTYNKQTVKENSTVIMEDNNITVKWSGHKITFEFLKENDMINYCGAVCDELYSASVSSYSQSSLPWKLWAQCGNDEITILTDLKQTYKIL